MAIGFTPSSDRGLQIYIILNLSWHIRHSLQLYWQHHSLQNMSQEEVNTFMAITNAESNDLAKHFIDMAGGDMETAISLFFEHGGNAQLNKASTNTDAELAGDLQNELYQQPQEDYRPPDEARHETLVDTHVFPGTYGGIGGRFQPLRTVRDMFDDSRPVGIFNQQISDNEDDSEFSDEEQYRQQFEYVEENVIELDDDGNVREYTKLVQKPRPMTKEQKLAMLFRPPFDMMAKVDLQGAKVRARENKKWILINIQAVDIFQCQALNRDLWSNKDVKQLVKKHFVFIQYQYDSQNALPYLQFYGLTSKDELPHIAILDPMTGERVKQWSRDVPSVTDFIDDINEFLNNFSLDPTSTNPPVREPTPALDPTTLSEEQQMELAIKKSLGSSSEATNEEDQKRNMGTEVHGDTADDASATLFNRIKPVTHSEPPNQPGITTRIQIRTGDGRRVVRRFNAMEDTVRTIYEVVKTEIEGYDDVHFTLSDHKRENLIEKLDESINDAGLKNSSLLLEKIQDD